MRPASRVAVGAAAVGAAFASAFAAACAPADEADEIVRPTELPVLALDEPSVEIGVLDGDDDLVFAAIESVIRLPEGSVAVSDAGRTRISLFTADGAFLRSWGSEGEGPGEFRSLSRIYPLGRDSLMAAERYTGRLTLFDLEGTQGRSQAGAEISGDTDFTLDSWLSGRFWVEGALSSAERERATTILAGLSVPPDPPGYRFARATDEGELWIREPWSTGAMHTWTRIGPAGPNAVIRTPTAFQPTHIRSGEVLGVWTGPSGVHFARAYAPVETGETISTPAWLASTSGGSDELVTEEEIMEEIRGSIRSLASAQEVHYSTAMSYTDAIDSLERFDPPSTIHLDILRADPRGWVAVFAHPGLERICGLAYGFSIPPGWTPGAILCGPEAGAARGSDATTDPTDRARR